MEAIVGGVPQAARDAQGSCARLEDGYGRSKKQRRKNNE
jgi:hypothetical protein